MVTGVPAGCQWRPARLQAARDAGTYRPNDIGALRVLDPRGGPTSMRYNVTPRVRNLTGLDVTEVNNSVKDVFFPSSRDKKDAHGRSRGRLELTACQEPAARPSAASDSRGCA